MERASIIGEHSADECGRALSSTQWAGAPRFMTPEAKWSERDWDRLLDDIRDGAVIPIVGEELYTVADAAGAEQLLYQAAAQRLASQLRLTLPEG